MLHSLSGRFRFLVKPQICWAVSLGIFGFLQRVFLWKFYQPNPYSDTNSYLRLAKVVSQLSLDGYDGTRVPGYPGFLALMGMDERRIWLGQMVLGWSISMILFWITWQTTHSPLLSTLVGVLYNLIPGQFLFEANLLTETLTSFWVLGSLAVLLLLGEEWSIGKKLMLSLLLGAVASGSGLVRPLFFPVTLWLVPFVWLALEGLGRKRLLGLLFYTVGPLLLQGGWILYIQNNFHVVSPTTMAGYSLVQHTGEFFEYLPDEVATIRDTYLEYRNKQINERGVQTNAIWEAIPAISKASGLGFYDLAREMRRLSIQLIFEHPDLYLKNVIEGWVNFWKAPVYWAPTNFHLLAVRNLISGLSVIGRVISIVSNAAFLFISGLGLIYQRARKVIGFDRHTVVAVGLVWIISILQTLVDHGDNPRFLVPLQMTVIYVVIRSAWYWKRSRSNV